MRIIGTSILQEFSRKHSEAAGPLSAWEREVVQAKWTRPLDVKHKYPKASIINGKRVVFNIRGNDFRLDVAIAYNTGVVQIVRIGTHLEYNDWKFD